MAGARLRLAFLEIFAQLSSEPAFALLARGLSL
jgi:hypothetical protein